MAMQSIETTTAATTIDIRFWRNLSISSPAGVWAMTVTIDEAAAAMQISAGFQFCEDFR